MSTYTLGRYVLVDRKPLLERDPVVWAQWMQEFDRRIFHAELHGPWGVTSVETDFLGVGHNPPWGGPYYFGTRVSEHLIGRDIPVRWRPRFTETWDEAAAVHLQVLDRLKSRKRDPRDAFPGRKEV